MLRGVRVGAGEQEAVVGELGLGGPHLLPVDHPLVPVEHRTGLQGGQVRPGVGFAEPLAPPHLALHDLGQELLLLLLGAPLQDGRTDEGVAEEVSPQRGLGPGELLGEHDALHQRQALAAVLLGPGGADPASLVEAGRPGLVERRPLVGAHLEAVVEPPIGQVLLEPGSDLDPELLGLGRIRQVHGCHRVAAGSPGPASRAHGSGTSAKGSLGISTPAKGSPPTGVQSVRRRSTNAIPSSNAATTRPARRRGSS